MSHIVISATVGRFRKVTDGRASWWLWECPKCGEWAQMNIEQWNGLVSVRCACGQYHETHNYGAALQSAEVAAILCSHMH